MTNLFAQAINFDDADRTAKIIQDALYRFVSREARKPTTNLSQMRDAAMAISRFPQYFPLRFCRLDNCSKQIATRQTVNSPALIHIRFIRLKNFPDRLSVSTKSLRSSPWSGRKAILSCQTDARRHGTTTLCAALEVATRRIIAVHSKRRRRVEFLGFMNSLVAAFPDRKLCVILNNVDTHKKNERWLMKHPPSVSISPIRSSWLNQVAFIGYTTRRPSDSSGRAALGGAHRG
jgi:hypothetical protein